MTKVASNGRRHIQRAMQAVGFVALLGLAVGAVLTAIGVFAGGLAASPAKPVHAAFAPFDTDTPTPTSTPDPCDPVWFVVPSPNGIFNDVAVVTANDVWAVGYIGSSELIEHWDGTSWSVVPSPNAGTLTGVAAVSANDVWAVGAGNGTLVEHWDGTLWSVVPSPNPGTSQNYLYGVAAVSATDVWAVGFYGPPSGASHTLVEHWDGTSWSVVPSPNVGATTNILYAITAVSANDMWAVGAISTGGHVTLTEHWDGSSWSVVPSPNCCPDNILSGVAAVSANDVWAVGTGPNTFPPQTLTEHWDGTSWSVVPSPSLAQSYLKDVAVVSATDVWAVGGYFSDDGQRTFVEHWDGTSWSVVPSPNCCYYNGLSGIAVAASNDVWGVGYANVEHYATLCGTPTNTPTNTFTPTSTATATATPTPTDTPTPCPSCTNINGHLTWQGVAPANRPSVPGTLQLCVGGSPQTFNFTTDTGGSFTVAVTTTLPDGTYHWRTKGERQISNSSPADGADLVITNGYATQEFGTQRGGDAANFGISNNIVNSMDFNALKQQFGLGGIRTADIDYNNVVNALDYNIMKVNFGQAGHNLICP